MTRLLEIPFNSELEDWVDIETELRAESLPGLRWADQAYPLQQVTIQLQGTRHSSRREIIDQLEMVLARLRAGDKNGQEHDDDFGYSFTFNTASQGPSFFDGPAGSD
jgi:hypothetical protein